MRVQAQGYSRTRWKAHGWRVGPETPSNRKHILTSHARANDTPTSYITSPAGTPAPGPHSLLVVSIVRFPTAAVLVIVVAAVTPAPSEASAAHSPAAAKAAAPHEPRVGTPPKADPYGAPRAHKHEAAGHTPHATHTPHAPPPRGSPPGPPAAPMDAAVGEHGGKEECDGVDVEAHLMEEIIDVEIIEIDLGLAWEGKRAGPGGLGGVGHRGCDEFRHHHGKGLMATTPASCLLPVALIVLVAEMRRGIHGRDRSCLTGKGR